MRSGSTSTTTSPAPRSSSASGRRPAHYVELLSAPFFSRLRRSPRQQILFFLHGYNCQPELPVFPDAERLQRLCDALAPGLVEVVPLLWPCDDDFGLVLDYFDDQRAADASGLAFARVLGKFMGWRDAVDRSEPCLKHVNILAHSMGNRVLRGALAGWAHDYGPCPPSSAASSWRRPTSPTTASSPVPKAA